MSQPICSPMMPSPPKTNKNQSFNEISTTIASVTESREPNHPKSIESEQKRMTNVPAQLVGEISSFLDQQSYSRFSSTNRKMFVDCNSPNRLTKMELLKLNQIRNVNFSEYPQLRYLQYSVHRDDSLSSRAVSISDYCHRLETLFISIGVGSDRELQQFVDSNSSGFDAVKTLVIWSRSTVSIRSKCFIQLLSLFPALKYLRIRKLAFNSPIHSDQLLATCPHIEKLFCDESWNELVILNGYSSKLDTLTLHPRHPDDFNSFPINWPKLHRLGLREPSYSMMDQLLVNAKKLKQICFAPVCYQTYVSQSREQRMTASEIGKMTTKLFSEYPSMDFIYISTMGHFERICNSIHQGLFRSQKVERNTLILGLFIQSTEFEDSTDFMCNISKILTALSGSNTKRWKLKLQFDQSINSKEMRNVIEMFLGSYPGSGMNLQYCSSNVVLIGNGRGKVRTPKRWWNDCLNLGFF